MFLFLLLLNSSQFNVSNTLPDTVLEQVSVIMQPQADDTGLSEDFIIPIPVLPTSTTPASFMSLSHGSDQTNTHLVPSLVLLNSSARKLTHLPESLRRRAMKTNTNLRRSSLVQAATTLFQHTRPLGLSGTGSSQESVQLRLSHCPLWTVSKVIQLVASAWRPLTFCRSCLRFDRGSPSHGASWRVPKPDTVFRAYDASVGFSNRRWRESSCPVSDDILIRCGRHIRAGCAG